MNVKKLLRDIDIVHKVFQKKFPVLHWSESFQENLKNSFTYLDFTKVDEAINNLLTWTNKNLSLTEHITHENHPIAIISIFHYKFLNEIHPFANGNGRIARLLTTLLLLKRNYPPALIKAEERQQYFQTLIQTEKEKKLRLHYYFYR
ncbi:MAG TPA: Fic family protein [Ohtaekwangia sp.]|uniref:Fic family protein n=1 Tax=Ohtaekwangia sp. TaxID=2066019 RepID=UPI002F935D74